MIQTPKYASLPEEFYQYTDPIPVDAPEWVIFNEALSKQLGDLQLDLKNHLPQFAGNAPFEGVRPLAQAYAGHQFANFTMLGDGRAHLIGEWKDPEEKLWDLHLKGSGTTKFSRGGDGRAALGPMLREYLISESLHALNIPTTRSLGVVKTGEITYRETPLPGAIVVRTASSHLRVGTFEYAATLDDPAKTRSLLEFAIERHNPDVKDAEKPALEFFRGVMDRQARLVAQWMSVGFIHGVMNTDNMTISGETIDYGPCAFMDTYDASTVFSSIDRRGRYAYGQQPAIAQWNLTRLAETLLPLVSSSMEAAKAKVLEALNEFPAVFEGHYFEILSKKLGLSESSSEDRKLFESLFQWLHHDKQDMTMAFRYLTEAEEETMNANGSELFQKFFDNWKQRLGPEGLKPAQLRMAKVNPVIIPRNHQVEEALEAGSNGEMEKFLKLLEAVQHPYSTDERFKDFRQPLENHSKTYQTFCGT